MLIIKYTLKIIPWKSNGIVAFDSHVILRTGLLYMWLQVYFSEFCIIWTPYSTSKPANLLPTCPLPVLKILIFFFAFHNLALFYDIFASIVLWIFYSYRFWHGYFVSVLCLMSGLQRRKRPGTSLVWWEINPIKLTPVENLHRLWGN